MPTTPIGQIQLRSSGSGGLANLTLPKMPYVPPPVDPRELPRWYEKFHMEHNKWFERVNQALTAQVG